jgi:hypothetical protein
VLRVERTIATVIGLAFMGAVALIFGILWVVTIIRLLREGPGDHAAWWAGCLAVVVLLGPLGAVAFLLADPEFTDGHRRRDREAAADWQFQRPPTAES